MKKDETKGQEAQDQAQPADISGYMAALESSFEPASELKGVTHWFSTDEVVDAIRTAHCDGAPSFVLSSRICIFAPW